LIYIDSEKHITTPIWLTLTLNQPLIEGIVLFCEVSGTIQEAAAIQLNSNKFMCKTNSFIAKDDSITVYLVESPDYNRKLIGSKKTIHPLLIRSIPIIFK